MTCTDAQTGSRAANWQLGRTHVANRCSTALNLAQHAGRHAQERFPQSDSSDMGPGPCDLTAARGTLGSSFSEQVAIPTAGLTHTQERCTAVCYCRTAAPLLRAAATRRANMPPDCASWPAVQSSRSMSRLACEGRLCMACWGSLPLLPPTQGCRLKKGTPQRRAAAHDMCRRMAWPAPHLAGRAPPAARRSAPAAGRSP